MTMDVAGFERALVRHCSPTLAGMKPACLFNVPGEFACDVDEEPAARLVAWRAANERRQRLACLIDTERELLAPAGIDLVAIAHRRCGALVYVFRPNLLAAALRERPVSDQLAAWGYRTSGPGWLPKALRQLGAKLERCHGSDEGARFPHEVGLFLGYPYADVMGFIEHDGRDYLCCGCWKVYEERERAEACFERYRRCTQAYASLLEMGASVGDLARVRIGSAA